MGITKELKKKSLLYFYTIYSIYEWSVLTINNLVLIFNALSISVMILDPWSWIKEQLLY